MQCTYQVVTASFVTRVMFRDIFVAPVRDDLFAGTALIARVGFDAKYSTLVIELFLNTKKV